MLFNQPLSPDGASVLRAMGFRDGGADTQTMAKLSDASDKLLQAATPRWIYKRFELEAASQLSGVGLNLQGASIKRHLAGCHACFIMAVTLGDGVERAIRAAETQDMAMAVLLDTLASNLTERYADAAEAFLRQSIAECGEYLTSRYSPGYGDLPLSHQREILNLLDTRRAIGLSVSASGILLPRKSITAIIGVADHPVSGHLAGCEDCALRDKCDRDKPCGKMASKLQVGGTHA